MKKGSISKGYFLKSPWAPGKYFWRWGNHLWPIMEQASSEGCALWRENLLWTTWNLNAFSLCFRASQQDYSFNPHSHQLTYRKVTWHQDSCHTRVVVFRPYAWVKTQTLPWPVMSQRFLHKWRGVKTLTWRQERTRPFSWCSHLGMMSNLTPAHQDLWRQRQTTACGENSNCIAKAVVMRYRMLRESGVPKPCVWDFVLRACRTYFGYERVVCVHASVVRNCTTRKYRHHYQTRPVPSLSVRFPWQAQMLQERLNIFLAKNLFFTKQQRTSPSLQQHKWNVQVNQNTFLFSQKNEQKKTIHTTLNMLQHPVPPVQQVVVSLSTPFHSLLRMIQACRIIHSQLYLTFENNQHRAFSPVPGTRGVGEQLCIAEHIDHTRTHTICSLLSSWDSLWLVSFVSSPTGSHRKFSTVICFLPLVVNLILPALSAVV